MKATFFLILLCLGIFSCNKKGIEEPLIPATNFTFKISNNTVKMYAHWKFLRDGRKRIYASDVKDGDTTEVNIDIYGGSTGTYNFTDSVSGPSDVTFMYSLNSSPYVAKSGTLVLSLWSDTQMSGTFNALCTDTNGNVFSVSEGGFELLPKD